MTEPTFETFRADALARGFDEVLVREWAPGTVLAEHTHPFAVEARVIAGQMTLTLGGRACDLRPGDTFEVGADVPHAEHYGPQGASYWVARRNPKTA